MKKLYASFIILCLIFVCITKSHAEIRLPKVITDGMVLQRETPLNIWGWADAGETVTISLKNQNYETTATTDGRWEILLPAQKAGGPYKMIISGSNEITLNNILFGDVWFCSGQSNMVIPLSRVSPLYAKEIESSANSNIRMFQVPFSWNYNFPQEDIMSGKWEEVNPQNILRHSAIGYFFARDLNAKYNIPIGIIECAVGGTPIEAWMSIETLKKFPEQYKEAKRLSHADYLQFLLESEQEARDRWFIELANNDLGRKEIPWSDPSLDDSAWPAFELPASFQKAKIGIHSGIVWFRKEITLPKDCNGKSALLEMGRIVDSDSIFINGKFVGNITYQYPPRRYNVAPGILKPGKNSIIVKVIGQSFDGGFISDKPYQLTVDGTVYDLKGTWKYQIGAKCGPCPPSTYLPGKPLGMFNAMLAPMTNYTIKGFLWYQGESNTDRAHEYNFALKTLIKEWRDLWELGNLPFLFVQLPEFMEAKNEPLESNWATLREQQLKTLSVTNTAMVVTLGLGEWNDIHPLRKKEVSERLALAAEKLAYRKNVVASGPLFKSMKVKGNKIEISFTGCGSGLTTSDGKELKYFAVAGIDEEYAWAKAKIKGNRVIVWNDSIKIPIQVRYAWADNPAGANLCNKEGLPASSFQTSE